MRVFVCACAFVVRMCVYTVCERVCVFVCASVNECEYVNLFQIVCLIIFSNFNSMFYLCVSKFA